MRKINLLLFAFFLLISAQYSFAVVDLELSLNSNVNEYNIYQKVTYTLTLDNTGDEASSNVKVSFPLPTGVAFSGSSATNGSYNLFFQEWSVGTLGANESATLDLTIFTLNADEPMVAFGQVIAASQSDSDSTPNNGTCCKAVEDDEADLTIYPEGYVGGGGEADLAITLYMPSDNFADGDERELSVRVFNQQGPDDATNVKVKLYLPEGLSLAANQVPEVDVDNQIISYASIPANQSLPISVQLVANSSVGSGVIFAEIIEADQTDPDSTPNNDTDQTPDEDDEERINITTNITDISLDMSVSPNQIGEESIVSFILDVRLNPFLFVETSNVEVEVRLPGELQYISHEIFGYESVQAYDELTSIWSIELMDQAPPYEVSLYRLRLQARAPNAITEPIQVSAQVIAHTPMTDIDSQPNSFPQSDFVYDREDDETTVMLYPIGTEPATIKGVTFIDNVFKQGIDWLSVEKNQGIDYLRVHLYDATDLNNPLQTIETFSFDIFKRGRYELYNLDPSKDYVVEYTPIGAPFYNPSSEALLLPGPVQRSLYSVPSERFSSVIEVMPGETIVNDFAWVSGQECTLNTAEADAICNDQNTADPSDDTYNIRYTATGKGAFSVSGGITVNNQEYPNNRMVPAESSYYTYPRFETYDKWFEAELNLPVSGASSQVLTFSNDATFSEVDCNEVIVVPPPSSCSQLIDMELEFTANPIAPAPTERTTLTVTLTNTGSATAEDTEVEVYLSEDGFPSGRFNSQVATVSQGGFEAITKIWNVGDLGAGETATLEIEAYPPNLLEGQTIPLFAQVIKAHGYDPDSDVNNDTDRTADEDDEGYILFGDDRKVDFELVAFYPVEASYYQEDIVEFYIEVRNSSDAEIEMDGATVAIDLPSNFVYDSFDFSACQGNCFYSAPAQGPNGMTFFNLMPGESISTIIRYSVTDFIGVLDVFAQVASQIQGDIDSAPNNGTCCTPQEDDEAFAQVTIEGDTTQEGVDLELQYEVASPTFNRWEKVNYTVTATNAGTESATKVVISTPIPNGLAFTSRMVSKGTFNLYLQTWTIPELMAGESATLNLTLFTLIDSPITNFAQVKSLDQTDVDSTPNNNPTNIPQEDDEAAVTITPNSGGGGKNALDTPIDQATTLALYQLFPVPALDNLQVVFGTAGYHVNVFVYDVHGKRIYHKSMQVTQGENAIEVDVSTLAAGFYTISLETPEGFVRGKFLKQ